MASGPQIGRGVQFTKRSQTGNSSETACWKPDLGCTNPRVQPCTSNDTFAATRRPRAALIREPSLVYRAEYIWIDGWEPTPLIRSKTKVIADGEEPGIWGFDGSSTNQAPGKASDCVLRPVFVCPDPLRGETTSWSCARCSSPT